MPGIIASLIVGTAAGAIATTLMSSNPTAHGGIPISTFALGLARYLACIGLISGRSTDFTAEAIARYIESVLQ